MARSSLRHTREIQGIDSAGEIPEEHGEVGNLPTPPPAIGHQYNYSTPAQFNPPINQGALQHPDAALGSLILSSRDIPGEDLHDQLMLIRRGDIITIGTTDYEVTSLIPDDLGTFVRIQIVPAAQLVDGEYTVTSSRP